MVDTLLELIKARLEEYCTPEQAEEIYGYVLHLKETLE